MKKFVCFVIVGVLLLSLVIMTGCGNESNSGFSVGTRQTTGNVSNTAPSPSNQSSSREPAQSVERSEVEAYVPPARLFKLDLSLEDPSNSDVKFEYDDEGRIIGVAYSIDDYRVSLQYKYDGRSITIFGFIGDIIVAHEELEASTDFDKSLGFIEYREYYFFGYSF